jgi:hypothetical protein
VLVLGFMEGFNGRGRGEVGLGRDVAKMEKVRFLHCPSLPIPGHRQIVSACQRFGHCQDRSILVKEHDTHDTNEPGEH